MRLYIRNNNTLDYTAGTGSIAYSNIAINGSMTKNFAGPADYPNNAAAWTSSPTASVVVNFAVGYNTMYVKVRAIRINAIGTVLSTGAYTAEQTITTTILTRTFAPAMPTIGITPVDTDRLVIDVTIRNVSGAIRTMNLNTTSASYVDCTMVQHKKLDIWKLSDYDDWMDGAISQISMGVTDGLKVYIGGLAFEEKPLKYHNGTTWVAKPVKGHNGSIWTT